MDSLGGESCLCRTCLAMILVTLAQPALANPHIVQATVPTFGCPKVVQLQQVTVMQLVTNAPLPGECFHIQVGALAYAAPEWQRNGLDVWQNVGVFATQSGRRFYSWPSTWRYAGEIRRFVQ
jgi:hypothetical protein